MITFLFFLLVYLLFIELPHLLEKQSPLTIEPKKWNIINKSDSILCKGNLLVTNPHKRMEVMIPEFTINTKILGIKDFGSLNTKVKITPKHPDLQNRKDEYWQAYIVKSKKTTIIEVEILLEDSSLNNDLENIESLWININWTNYGPFGRKRYQDGFVIPIQYPSKGDIIKNRNIISNDFSTLSIKTHLLGRLDDPIELIYKYTSDILVPGDILTIGETPLAIMQGRYIHPSKISTSKLSKFLCIFFHPTSSLATASGMQTLINEVGPSRVILAWLIGALFKSIKIKGFFYRLAGEQARLIDDITGTTPPYDQTIVLGPQNTNDYCQDLSNYLGVHVAVVDVNDLGSVKVLACSNNTNQQLIKKALKANPAGNADEQTPIVIIRPS